MAAKYDCQTCLKQITATKNSRYRAHTDGDGNACPNSGETIPDHILEQPVTELDAPDVPREGVDFAVCPNCERKVKLTKLGYFEPHETTLKGGDRCPVGGVRAKHARKIEDNLLPGDGPASPHPKVRDSSTPAANRGLTATAEPAPDTSVVQENLARTPMSAPSAESGASTASSSPESTTTSEPSPSEPEGPEWFFLESPHAILVTARGFEEGSAGAGSGQQGLPRDDDFGSMLFEKPKRQYPEKPKGPVIPMGERALELAARLRETFYAYTNRNSSDNRSAQRTIGPSEAGTPCDRQLAMKLLGITPVNPQEGWAPFVGTAVHAELANMFDWANGAGSGRYVTEMSVSLGSELVPRGTLDLLDRVLYMIGDHKLMGRYSLDKLRKEGPSETYRKQIQIYGLGAELAGEKVREVAIIGWPRQESSLDKLYVHVEKYDRRIAEEALERVTRIAETVRAKQGPGTPRESMSVARAFPVADDCRWCPFFLENDGGMERGCPGR